MKYIMKNIMNKNYENNENINEMKIIEKNNNNDIDDQNE